MGPAQYDIQQVQSLVADAHGVTVGLANGSSAFLDRAHPEYDWILRLLRHCEQGGSVLGFLVEEGKILDVGGAYCSVVAGVQPPRPQTPEVEVWFGLMDGPMLLATAHPSFSRLYDALVRAKETGEAVWWVMKGGGILDVHVLTPAEDPMMRQRIEQKG